MDSVSLNFFFFLIVAIVSWKLPSKYDVAKRTEADERIRTSYQGGYLQQENWVNVGSSGSSPGRGSGRGHSSTIRRRSRRRVIGLRSESCKRIALKSGGLVLVLGWKGRS